MPRLCICAVCTHERMRTHTHMHAHTRMLTHTHTTDMHVHTHAHTNNAQGFTRSTTKYWVRNEDVSTVKHHVLQHLPVFQFDKNNFAGDAQVRGGLHTSTVICLAALARAGWSTHQHLAHRPYPYVAPSEY